MKSYLPFLSLTLLIASCTTYKSGQTPDDVYYSPAQPSAEYVNVEDRDSKKYNYNDNTLDDDPYLRMRVYDRRWSLLDDYDFYPSYSYVPGTFSGYGLGFYNYSPLTVLGWNYNYNPYFLPYYSPYSYHLMTLAPVTPVYNRPRTFNLSVYNPAPVNQNAHQRSIRVYNSTPSRNNNSNYRGSGTNAGGFLRNVFNNSGGGNHNSFSPPSYSPSTRSSSGGGFSGGSSGSRSSAPAPSGRRF